jgi:hypothetical protein
MLIGSPSRIIKQQEFAAQNQAKAAEKMKETSKKQYNKFKINANNLTD